MVFAKNVVCECGGEYKPNGQNFHERGKQHRAWRSAQRDAAAAEAAAPAATRVARPFAIYEQTDDERFLRDLETVRGIDRRATPQERAKQVRQVFHNYELDHFGERPPFTVLDVLEAWGVNSDRGARGRQAVEAAAHQVDTAQAQLERTLAQAKATQAKAARESREGR